MKGLFINNFPAKDSIFESGLMVYNCLLLSKNYTLDYLEIDQSSREIPLGYNFYFFNYHPFTMGWLDTKNLKRVLGCVGTIILEVAPDDPFVLCPENDFSFYCVLDPTLRSDKNNVYSFPRPLEKIRYQLPEVKNDIPIIGSFGFATKGKGFQHVVEAVNKEFDKAIVKINIPYGDFVKNSKEYASFLGNICKQKAKPGIEVIVTNDFMDKDELIKWCSSNTLNCFLYDRNMPGLAATTDQAIASERPLAVSDNDTFRHIISYIKPYPAWSLRDSISNSIPYVKRMKEDWSAENFARKFESLLNENRLIVNQTNDNQSTFTLPVKKKTITDLLEKRIKKYKRKLKKINLKSLIQNDTKRTKKII